MVVPKKPIALSGCCSRDNRQDLELHYYYTHLLPEKRKLTKRYIQLSKEREIDKTSYRIARNRLYTWITLMEIMRTLSTFIDACEPLSTCEPYYGV
jgi:hypothetical protein